MSRQGVKQVKDGWLSLEMWWRSHGAYCDIHLLQKFHISKLCSCHLGSSQKFLLSIQRTCEEHKPIASKIFYGKSLGNFYTPQPKFHQTPHSIWGAFLQKSSTPQSTRVGPKLKFFKIFRYLSQFPHIRPSPQSPYRLFFPPHISRGPFAQKVFPQGSVSHPKVHISGWLVRPGQKALVRQSSV